MNINANRVPTCTGLDPAPGAWKAMTGQVEKDQATLAEAARAMLERRNVPNKYWQLTLQTAAYVKNRTPHEALRGRLPIEVGTGETLEPGRLRTFGCAAYVQIESPFCHGPTGISVLNRKHYFIVQQQIFAVHEPSLRLLALRYNT